MGIGSTYLAGLQVRMAREQRDEELRRRKKLADIASSAFRPGYDQAIPFETDEEQAFGLPPLQGNSAGSRRVAPSYDDEAFMQSLAQSEFAPEAQQIYADRQKSKDAQEAELQKFFNEKSIENEMRRREMDYAGSMMGGASPTKRGWSQKQGLSMEFDPSAEMQMHAGAEAYRKEYGRYPPGYSGGGSNVPFDPGAGMNDSMMSPAATGGQPPAGSATSLTSGMASPPPGLSYGDRQKFIAEQAKEQASMARADMAARRSSERTEAQKSRDRLAELNTRTAKISERGPLIEEMDALLSRNTTGPGRNVTGFFKADRQTFNRITAEMLRSFIEPGTSGTGNSDAEQANIFKMFPKWENSNAANAAGIRALRASKRNAEDKADFMNWYVGERGNDDGAESAWRRYINSNPTLMKTPKSDEFGENRNKITWQTYFGAAQPQNETPRRTLTRDPQSGKLILSP